MKLLRPCSRSIIFGVIAAAGTGGLSQSAQATIVEVSRWHLGEAGSLSGNFGLDSLNTDGAFNNFNNANGVTYLTATPPTNSGSTAYLHTAGTAGNHGEWIFTNSPASTAQTIPAANWGIELWARSTTTIPSGFRSVLNLGSAANSQLAIEAAVTGGNVYWDVNKSGVSNMIIPRNATTQVITGDWDNLALINDAGTIKFYVNGILAGSSTTATTNNGYIHLAIKPSTGGNNFIGDFDELRFFTFSAGQFSTDDLYINNLVPEPSSFAMLLFGTIGMWLLRRHKPR